MYEADDKDITFNLKDGSEETSTLALGSGTSNMVQAT
jgi:hypothetical protein